MPKKSDESPSDRPPSIADLEHRPPYPETIPKKEYERELHALQVELVKMQQWVIENGERIVVVFEGRDAAGKGGAISRFTQYLNPRQRSRRGAAEAERHRAQPVVLPALRQPSADGGRDRVVRPLLVQPRRRRARDGLLHRRRVRGVLPPGARLRAQPRSIAASTVQAVVHRVEGRAAATLRGSQDRSAATVEAVADRRRGAASLPRVRRGPRRRCCFAPITPTRRGRSSTPTTSDAPDWRRSVTCCRRCRTGTTARRRSAHPTAEWSCRPRPPCSLARTNSRSGAAS